MKTPDYANLKPTVDGLIISFGFQDLEDEENYADDQFTGKGCCGERRPAVAPDKRQQLVWNFLAVAAALYVDTSSHEDGEGYWVRETNHDRSNNIDGDTIESVDHLMCNLTAVRPRVEMCEGLDGSGRPYVYFLAGAYRRWSGIPDEFVRASQKVNF